MPARSAVVVGALACFSTQARAEETNPIAKVVNMLSDLEGKVIKEGEVAHKEYASYAEWCEDTSKQLHYEIKTGSGEIADLKATIVSEDANSENLNTKIEELGSKTSQAEADLKAATEIRKKENDEFVAEEKELNEVLSALGRAIHILSKEMAKGGSASMLQFSRMGDVTKALGAMVQASALDAADGERLTALVQSANTGGDDDEGTGAPDASVYEGHSGNIIEVLEGLQDKAEEQLASARKAETTAKNNFEMIRQSLTDEISVAGSEMDEAKNGLAASKEARSVAQGDLDVTSKALAEDQKALADAHQVCMDTAQEYEAGTNSRSAELDSLAAAKKVLKEMTGGAESLSYGLAETSLLQTGSVKAAAEPRQVERFVLGLAKKQQSKALAQLAHRIASTVRMATSRNQDPFQKVKGLISDMIARLEDEGSADASHKAYCDKETSETKAKEADKSAEIEKLSTSIDKMTSRIAVLQEEVATLTKDLALIAKSQSEFDAWFQETEATFNSNKADMDAGIKGVQVALKVLRDYYASEGKAHNAADGAGGNIIGLLEVVEADFTKGLAEMTSTIESQKADHEASTKDNQLATTAKTQDVKYKNHEMTDLKKALKDTTADRTGVETEMAAVTEYLAKISEQCIEKAEPYEETKRRREAEIAGLKEALEVLEGEAVLLQSGHTTMKNAQLRGNAQ